MNKVMMCLVAAMTIFASFTSDVESAEIKVLAEMSKRPGNPAIGPNGEIILSMQPFDGPEYKVAKLGENGQLTPFPTESISRNLAAVIGVATSSDGVVWILDMGSASQSPKLLGWSIPKNRLEATYYIPIEVAGENPFIQDLTLDASGKFAFIADMSRGDLIGKSLPAFIVIDLESGEMKRVLEGHPALQPKTDVPSNAGGKVLQFTHENGRSEPVLLGLNPIGLNTSNNNVIFSTITPGPVYSIPSAVLSDFDKSEEVIASHITVIGNKDTSDGIAVDGDTTYLTNVNTGAIEALKNGNRRIVSNDARLSWPDGIAIDKDGSLIVTVNQLHHLPPFNAGVGKGKPPYLVIRISE